MARKGPADRDGAEALRRLLSGLARGEDVFGLAAAIEELHPGHNTFPGEVFMRLPSLDPVPPCRRPAVFPSRDRQ
jgi:hypothetical protein